MAVGALLGWMAGGGGASKQTPAPQPIFPGVQNAFLYGGSGPNPGVNRPPGANAFVGGGNDFASIFSHISNTTQGSGVPRTGGIVNAGQQGINTLQGMASGQDFSGLFNSIINARDYYQKQGQANLTEQFGSMGLRFSGPLAAALNNFNLQFGAETEQELQQLGLQEQGLQLSAASDLANMWSNVATAFYQPGFTPNTQGSMMSGTAALLAQIIPLLMSSG